MSNPVAAPAAEASPEAIQPFKGPSLVMKFGNRYNIEPGKLMAVLKQTAFRQKEGAEVSDAQMVALLVVADQYGLNPFTREIFAFPDKQNGIVPVVSVDGWSRIVNDHKMMDGFEFRESDEPASIDKDHRPCPDWIEVVFYRKDRSHPSIVREYLDEVYRPLGTYQDGNKHKPGPWQTHTKRFLRHKTFIQGARIVFGFTGIYDQDEAERIVEAQVIEGAAAGETRRIATTSRSAGARIADALGDTPENPDKAEGGQGAAPEKSDKAASAETVDAIIRELDKYDESVEVMMLYLDEVDDFLRGDLRIAAAVKRKVDEINARVRQEKPADKPRAPYVAAVLDTESGKYKGTPEILDRFLDRIRTSVDLDVLAVVVDEARGYLWPGDTDLAKLNQAYAARVAALEK